MKEEFPDWFGSQIRQCHVDKDPGVSASSELFALAYGPTPTLISVNSCIVNGVRFVVHNRDEHRTTQNSGICSPVKRFDTSNEGRKFKHLVLRNNMTQIWAKEDDPDVIHFDNSSDLALSSSLNDLDFATLHIDGQSTDVDAPPDIIDVDEDNDIIDDEDTLPYDLAYSDDEDLVNVDDDDDVAMLHRATMVTVAVMIAPLHTIYPPVTGVASLTEVRISRLLQRHPKTQLGWKESGQHTRQETRNLELKKITDDKGPVPIRFEWDDKKTMMPFGDHASHWSNYLGELIREMPLYYPSWQKVLAERKAAIVTKIGTQFDLKPHMQSQRWTDINAGIQQHLQKLYNTNKASLKAAHWVINPETGTYDVETIRQGRPESITPADWDAQIAFWNDPRNQARAAQNRQNRAKSTVVCRQGSRSLARLRDEMMASSETREYPSLIDTFFVTHTVNGVFIRDEDRAIYEEMVRLRALGSNTESGVPYTDEEINAMARKGKQRGHLPGVGRVLPGRARDVLIPPPPPPPQCTHNSGDVEKLKKKNKYLTKQVNLMMKLFRSDDKFSQMLTLFGGVTDWYQSQGYREPAVMSSASSAVTYTSVYTDSEPGRVFWGADEEISDGGPPRVIVYGYDGLPMQLVVPPSPDYIPGLEEPHIPLVPQDEDERELMFIQPHDPDYIPELIYPEYISLEDEHEYEDAETEDGPVDCLMDGGDDGDDDDGDSSGDDADDEDEDVIPPPSTDITTTGARITVRLQASHIPFH
ncbi:retrotransposon protein, putative, ty3-gypsy subclass [Tanacetum coccineum]